MHRTPFDYKDFFSWLESTPLKSDLERLRVLCTNRTQSDYHGSLPTWTTAIDALPQIDATLRLTEDAVAIEGVAPVDTGSLHSSLQALHPWRKGPFRFFDLPIDTEWKSNWKFDRLSKAVEFQDKRVLDVGAGNGYYGWRMLGSGARIVLGCDPSMLYLAQFEAVKRYANENTPHYLIPVTDVELPTNMRYFDLALSMGVLYHRTSPIDHLRFMHSTLVNQGTLALETLVIEDEQPAVLVPTDRYAKMRNVWFIPSIAMLQLWLERTGFQDIRVHHIGPTTNQEQRKTEWMRFESLDNFLDPHDCTRTVEGYPAPVRVLLTATAR